MKDFPAIDTNPTTSSKRTMGKTTKSMVLSGVKKSSAARTHVAEKIIVESCNNKGSDEDDEKNTHVDKNGGFSGEQAPQNNIKKGGFVVLESSRRGDETIDNIVHRSYNGRNFNQNMTTDDELVCKKNEMSVFLDIAFGSSNTTTPTTKSQNTSIQSTPISSNDNNQRKSAIELFSEMATRGGFQHPQDKNNNTFESDDNSLDVINSDGSNHINTNETSIEEESNLLNNVTSTTKGNCEQKNGIDSSLEMSTSKEFQSPESTKRYKSDEDNENLEDSECKPVIYTSKEVLERTHSPSSDELEATEAAKDLTRRQKEISFFAAMANPGGGFVNPTSVNNHKSDVIRCSSAGYNTNDYCVRMKKDIYPFSATSSRRSKKSPLNIITASSPTGKTSPIDTSKGTEILKDLARRVKEMKLFSAMANSQGISLDSENTSRKSDSVQDADRRKKEMYAFSAIASEDSTSPTYIVSDCISNGISSKTSTSNIDMSKCAENAEPKKKEIELFSALATGSKNAHLHDKRVDICKLSTNEDSTTVTMLHEGSGTFVSNKKEGTTSNIISITSKSNIKAALASLSDSAMTNSFNNTLKESVGDTSSSTTLDHIMKPTVPRRKPLHNQMYTECVLLPRPLFFGHTLPARVMAEARRLRSFGCRLDDFFLRENENNTHDLNIVNKWNQHEESTSQDISLEAAFSLLPTSSSTTPRASPSSMPSENDDQREREYDSILNGACDDGPGGLAISPEGCKNFEGAIMAYGYGFARRMVSCTNSFEIDNADRLKLYVPVWGDLARLEREDRIRLTTKTCKNDGSNNENVATNTYQSAVSSNTERVCIDEVMNPASKKFGTASSHDEHVKPLSTTPYESTTTMDFHPCDVDRSYFDINTIQSVDKDNESPPLSPSNNPLTMAKDLFSQYARDDIGNYGDSLIPVSKAILSPLAETTPPSPSSTTPTPHLVTSHPSSNPSGAIEGSELKKQVGVNDNLSRALESLSEGGVEVETSDGAVSLTAVDAAAVVAEAAATMVLTDKDGMPLTNLELFGGHVPVYGCDDDPLPCGADLGNYETKEEQLKSGFLSEWQEIIALKAEPNIFAPIICPNIHSRTDDSHACFSRVTSRQGLGGPGSRFPRSLTSSSKGRTSHEKKISGKFHNSSSSVDSANGSIVIQSSIPRPPPIPPIGSDTSAIKGHQSLEQTQQLNHVLASSGQYSSRTLPHVSAGRKSIHQQNQEQNHQQPSHKSKTADVRWKGWWNVPDEFDCKLPKASEQQNAPIQPPLLLPPKYDEATHSSENNLLFPPSVKQLLEQNRSLSDLHPSTSTTKFLPFLSDRPPSTRYLQIDTLGVGFHSIGEVEPLFCSLAIWYAGKKPSKTKVKKKKQRKNINDSNTNSATDSIGSEMPSNATWCGRITESLRFDVVTEAEVETKCKAALWPNEKAEDSDISFAMSSYHEAFQRTRCGIFPLPSKFNISDLYAVLVVHKTLSDDSELDIYMKSKKQKVDDKSTTQEKAIHLQRHRNKAGMSSNQLGNFLMPFAIGVAPLIGVIGSEPPSVPVSRGVKIPLLKLASGLGEQSIIDHILIQLNRQGNVKNPELLKEGSATFIMRNFGYLGLHSAIVPRSICPRDRVVDFTGDLQFRRRHLHEIYDTNEDDRRVCMASTWQKDYVSEPTVNGGRSFIGTEGSKDSTNSYSNTALYAQELAPLPLLITQPANQLPSFPGAISSSADSLPSCGGDADSFFYTSLCNELFCQPQILHWEGFVKRNIVIKIEVRRLRFCEAIHRYIATLPRSGPSLHNIRRGSFLVNELFTACAYDCLNPRFLDEFKIKLPFMYSNNSSDGKLVALFTAYNVVVREKKKKQKEKAENTNGNNTDTKSTAAPLELLGCGYLPLFTDGNVPCLISNMLHDVRLNYITRPLISPVDSTTSRISQKCDSLSDALVLEPLSFHADKILITQTYSSPAHLKNFGSRFWRNDKASDSVEERLKNATAKNLTSNNILDHARMLSIEHRSPSPSPTSSIKDTSSSNISQGMVLQVRTIALSSVHPQNMALAQFFRFMPMVPRRFTNENLDWKWAISSDKLSDYSQQCQTRTLENQEPSSLDDSLLHHTLEIASPTCSQFELIPHFVRIIHQLWRSLVCGNGEPSLMWANPSRLIPLRLHSFSTLLHILNSFNSSLIKSGLKQLDGKSKWNITSTSRLVMMLFDEDDLFLDMYTESIEDILQHDAQISKVDTVIFEDENHQHNDFETCPQHRPVISENKSSDIVKDISFSKISKCSSFSQSESGDFLRTDGHTSRASKDDLNLLDFVDKPMPLRSRSNSAPNPKPLKIDTKTDFQSALNKANSPKGTNLYSGPGLGPAANRRRWMTLPNSALATIQEDNDKISENVCDSGVKRNYEVQDNDKENTFANDELDTELVFHKSKPSKVKQMRVPFQSIQSKGKKLIEENKKDPGGQHTATKTRILNKTVPKDEEIELTGSAFLDTIGKTFGNSTNGRIESKDKQVGLSHHRKTRSRCSIDWNLLPTGLLTDNHQQIEHSQLHDASPPLINSRNGENDKCVVRSDLLSTVSTKRENHQLDKKIYKGAEAGVSKKCVHTESKNHPFKLPKRRQKKDSKNEAFLLPNYAERIVNLGKKRKQGRWFPYIYEVIIFQWSIFLSEQPKKTEKARSSGNSPGFQFEGRSQISHSLTLTRAVPVAEHLSEAASKVEGLSIRLAPVLLEIIKKSLGFRIDTLFRRQRKHNDTDGCNTFMAPPLVTLDSSITSALEELISKVTDACIDSRNFDSLMLHKSAFIVNDSIVRFLRDLFAFLDTRVVHRLILVYFSRFGMREGKHWQDGDSKIGFRCSEEISKLKLNAVTLLIRFADFVKVNCPVIEQWGNRSFVSTRSSRHFYTDVLSEFENLSMSNFIASGVPARVNSVVPSWKPHWLIEVVTDICLSSTSHTEFSLRQRSASLLFELFWSSNREGKVHGTLKVVASMYVPFILKMIGHAPFLSSLSPKSQLSKDLFPCVVFIIQSAPSDLLRALWRKLCKQMKGRVSHGNFGGIGQQHFAKLEPLRSCPRAGINDPSGKNKNTTDQMYSILDVFSLLNLALKSFEYEGSEANIEEEAGDIVYEKDELFKEFLPAVNEENSDTQDLNNIRGRIPMDNYKNSSQMQHEKDDSLKYTTDSSRKWHAHDGASAIINACREIVCEYFDMSQLSDIYKSLHVSSDQFNSSKVLAGNLCSDNENTFELHVPCSDEPLKFSLEEKVIFARGALSVYLHCLSLRQSDIVYIKTLMASVEIVKVFDIRVFLASVGETVQHWMRVILVHCGARREKVRTEALEFLALMLRLTWDSFGNLNAVKVPLIAIQTEVMERIIATAAARFHRRQRKLKLPAQLLSNEGAEAALTPFWRTLDRLHHFPTSNNAPFKSALDRLAESMKILYKALIAAHALAVVNRINTQSPLEPHNDRPVAQISRVLSASGGFSRKILGSQGSHLLGNVFIHSEAVEEAFLAAADLFIPTELPLHRVAWLRKLAEFHSSRSRFAEEGACRFLIHETLRQAADHYDNLWNNIPFCPWTDDASDRSDLDSEWPIGSTPEYYYGDYLEEFTTASSELYDFKYHRSYGDWDVGADKHLFHGVTLPSEYNEISPRISLRELQEDMVEEVETAGESFLKAGMIESSRYAWGLSTQIYSLVYNYTKLAYAYRKLALVVESAIPIVDSTQIELSSPLGRFYRVYFHGGAADELMGKEFVYRASVSVKFDMFCNSLIEAIHSILPDNTPIEIVKDDERVNESQKRDQRRIGTPREAITIKVTPLRPILDRHNCARGTPEWFYQQSQISKRLKPATQTVGDSRCHHSIPQKNHYFSSSNSFKLVDTQNMFDRGKHDKNAIEYRGLSGVNKFLFAQSKDRSRACRDMLKVSNGDFSEKSLKVTELLVKHSFPASVTRQSVVQRTVFSISPLEAGVEEVCSWSAVLFRTAIATNGLALIGNQGEEGIGKSATKVVAKCLYSRVKEIGQTMLNKVITVPDNLDVEYQSERLSDDERNIIQSQLARAIVTLMEILLVLIGRNRELLLPIVKAKKRIDSSALSHSRFTLSPSHLSSFDGTTYHNDFMYAAGSFDDCTGSPCESYSDCALHRSDNPLVLQRELQFAFKSMIKALYPNMQKHCVTPQWMRQCCQGQNYFSSMACQKVRIVIAKELSLFDSASQALKELNVDNDDGESDLISIPEILQINSNSAHESCAGSSTSRAS